MRNPRVFCWHDMTQARTILPWSREKGRWEYREEEWLQTVMSVTLAFKEARIESWCCPTLPICQGWWEHTYCIQIGNLRIMFCNKFSAYIWSHSHHVFPLIVIWRFPKGIIKSHTVTWSTLMISCFVPPVYTVNFMEAKIFPKAWPAIHYEHQELFQVRSSWPKTTGVGGPEELTTESVPHKPTEYRIQVWDAGDPLCLFTLSRV